jgi:hypothetical protein
MSLVGWVSKDSPENYMCKCGSHRYSSPNVPEKWFTKKEWEEWIESLPSIYHLSFL